MCSVAGMALTGAIAALAGGIVSGIAGKQQADQQADMAKYQADLEQANARNTLIQAENYDMQQDNERRKLQLNMLNRKGEARTSYAAGGVVLGSGSSADYEADIMDAYDLDSKNLDYDIANKKWQMQVQAANHQDQANLYRAQAKGYKKSGTVSLISGVFSGLGNSADGFGKAFSLWED